MTDSPSEEWKYLDWAKATKKMAVYERWEGCPIQTVDGAHFLGHGRALLIVVDSSGYDCLLIYFLSNCRLANRYTFCVTSHILISKYAGRRFYFYH